MLMNLRRCTIIALAAVLLCTGGMARAADILTPSTPSLTGPADATGQPAATTTTTTETTTAAPGDTDGKPVPTPKTGDMLKLSTGPDAAPPIDPKEIPDVVMEEMKQIENSCTKNYFYSSFHDCKCISVKFLDARLKSDPNMSKDRVFNSIAAQCVDEPGVAGYVYKSCADYMKSIRVDFDSFCTCSANKVAASYKKNPMMSLRYIESLRRNAFVDCGIRNKVEKPSKTLPKKFEPKKSAD
ncbi:MAG: hypothetical protein JWO78_31 [Micavibrio sp.]|nr:hypothetical protein [Micavibrio sp.]